MDCQRVRIQVWDFAVVWMSGDRGLHQAGSSKRGWEEGRGGIDRGKASRATWARNRSKEEEESKRTARFDQIKGVKAAVMNWDEEDWYCDEGDGQCRWHGEDQEFCFAQVHFEMPRDIPMGNPEGSRVGAQWGWSELKTSLGNQFWLSLKPQTGGASELSHAGRSYSKRWEKNQEGGRGESWKSA